MLSDKKIIEYFQESRKLAENKLSKQRKENEINRAFYAGNKKIAFKDASLPAESYVYFNYCHPIVNAVAGFMIQHRRKPEYLAKILQQQEQQLRTQYLNSISDSFRDNANFDQIESKQDLDMIITGLGFVDIVISYDNEHGSDPLGQGEVDVENVDPNDVWWDISAKEQNLLDARYIARRKAFHKKDIKNLFGKDADELETQEYELGEKTPVFNDGLYQSERDLEYVSGSSKEQIVVHSFQWWDYEKFYNVENPIYQTQNPEKANILYQALINIDQIRKEEDMQENEVNYFNPKDRFLSLDKYRYNDLKEIANGLAVDLTAIEYNKRTYYTALISGETILDKYKNIHQSGFTIKAKTGYFDNTRDLWFGMVTLMREPAKYNAKALTEIMKATETLAKSGIIAEKGITDNHKEFEYRYNKEKSVIWINDGASGRLQDKRQPALPTGWENIMQESENAIRKTTNITPELLGNTENKNATAALERQRIKQAMTSLATFFDSITLYQIESARLMIDYIKILSENAPDRIVKIIGEDGSTQFAPLMSDMLACEFQVDIGEAPDSPTQREETAMMMMQLADKFVQTGMGNIYPVALNYIEGLKETDRQQIIEMITPKPTQPDPLEAAQKQKLIEMMDAEVKKTQADTVDKQNSAMQRQADIQAKLAGAMLDQAKAKGENVTSLQKVYNPFIKQEDSNSTVEGQQQPITNEVINEQ